MITFKQFLHEEDEEDTFHDSVEAAAREYIKHCTQFPDIDNPLYRLSGDSWLGPINHPLRTRVPRRRKSESRASEESASAQRFIFSQPAWKDYPPRRQSIFCSTTQDFVVDSVDPGGANLLMIYPFDGVKIAVLNDQDLNTMNVLKGVTTMNISKQIDDFMFLIQDAYAFIFREVEGFDPLKEVVDKLKDIKDAFNNDGKFNSEANGNDELADIYAELASENEHAAKFVKLVATEIPERLTPRAWGAKLVTPGGLDLPGPTRECWFSGKYLSVPYRYHDEFKVAVKKLQS